MQEPLFDYEAKKSENDIEAELVKYMQARGWRPTRNHVGLFRSSAGFKLKIGIVGFPDWTFSRGTGQAGTIQLCHVEAKAPGKKPAKVQLQVMASLNHLGELATWTDDMLKFDEWYRAHFND